MRRLKREGPGAERRAPRWVKTDKRDAERLALLLAAGESRFAFVPGVAHEQSVT
jgi:hypothetical protein